MEKNNNYDLLKKAKKAVWLNRWFGTYIPEECEKFIINQECCSEEFMTRFILSRRLLYQSEQLLVDKFAQSKPSLLKGYMALFGLCSSAQVKVIETKNVELIQEMFHYLPPTSQSTVLSTLVELKDPELLKESLREVETIDFRPTIYLDIFKSGDFEMFKALISLRSKFSSQFDFNERRENELLSYGTPEMIEWFCEHEQLHDANLIALLNHEIINKRTELFVDPAPIFSMFIDKGITFSDAVLLKMVDNDCKDLLKLYYLKHGLNPQILAYYNNLHYFKQDVGLLKS